MVLKIRVLSIVSLLFLANAASIAFLEKAQAFSGGSLSTIPGSNGSFNMNNPPPMIPEGMGSSIGQDGPGPVIPNGSMNPGAAPGGFGPGSMGPESMNPGIGPGNMNPGGLGPGAMNRPGGFGPGFYPNMRPPYGIAGFSGGFGPAGSGGIGGYSGGFAPNATFYPGMGRWGSGGYGGRYPYYGWGYGTLGRYMMSPYWAGWGWGWTAPFMYGEALGMTAENNERSSGGPVPGMKPSGESLYSNASVFSQEARMYREPYMQPRGMMAPGMAGYGYPSYGYVGKPSSSSNVDSNTSLPIACSTGLVFDPATQMCFRP